MTIAMLALAGFPATAGFFGKIYLINAAVDNGYALARHRHRARLGGLAGLLPAGRRRGLDARARRGSAPLVRACRSMAGGSPEADEEDRAAGREPGADVGARRSPTTSTSRRVVVADRPPLASPRSCSSPSSCALVTIVVRRSTPSRCSNVAQRRRRRDHLAALSQHPHFVSSRPRLIPGGELFPRRPLRGRAIASHRRSGHDRVHRRDRPHGGGDPCSRRAGGGRALDVARRVVRADASARCASRGRHLRRRGWPPTPGWRRARCGRTSRATRLGHRVQHRARRQRGR